MLSLSIMKWLQHIIICLTTFILSVLASDAQVKLSETLEVDKTVHNFGDIIHKSGPVSCSFTLKNTGEKPVVIYNVVTTCGCTDVDWTKEPIRPGQSGKISVTYSNDEGGVSVRQDSDHIYFRDKQARAS